MFFEGTALVECWLFQITLEYLSKLQKSSQVSLILPISQIYMGRQMNTFA